jgi:hypothetical protein
VAVTIQEHYDIHFSQGDYGACTLMGKKMNLSPQEISTLASINNELRIKNGTHNLLGENNPSHKRVRDGTFHLLGPTVNKQRLLCGTHPSQIKISCLICKKEVDVANFSKYHGDKCGIFEGKDKVIYTWYNKSSTQTVYMTRRDFRIFSGAHDSNISMIVKYRHRTTKGWQCL